MSVNEEQTETVASFYSPLDTPHDSDEEADLRSRFLYRNSVSFDDEQYISKAKGAFEKAWRFVNEDGWHVEKTKDNGDVVCTRTVAKCKIYLFTGVIGVPVNVLVDELFTHVENIPSWNPNMMECKVIQEVDDQTKISYQVTNEVGKGVISSRDFVTVHRYEVRDGCHISAGIGVEHKLRPNLQKYIRAENGPSAWVIKPVSEILRKYGIILNNPVPMSVDFYLVMVKGFHLAVKGASSRVEELNLVHTILLYHNLQTSTRTTATTRL